MARASAGSVTVNFEDGQYVCFLRRVPAKEYREIAKQFIALEEVGDDSAKGAVMGIDALIDMVQKCVVRIVDMDIDDLDTAELSAIMSAVKDFTLAQMESQATRAGIGSS